MNERERLETVDDYLGRLDRELRDLPIPARRELVEDVQRHIEDAWASSQRRDRVGLLTILERVGEPADVAREGRERLGLPTTLAAQVAGPSPDRTDPPFGGSRAAVVLTAIFWPLGLLLVWLSSAWRARDKWIATSIAAFGFLLLLGSIAWVGSERTLVVNLYENNGDTAMDLAMGGPPRGVRVVLSNGPNYQQPASFVEWALAAPSLLCSALGASFLAATYLAMRRLPSPNKGAMFVPVVAVALVVAVVAFLLLTNPLRGY